MSKRARLARQALFDLTFVVDRVLGILSLDDAAVFGRVSRTHRRTLQQFVMCATHIEIHTRVGRNAAEAFSIMAKHSARVRSMTLPAHAARSTALTPWPAQHEANLTLTVERNALTLQRINTPLPLSVLEFVAQHCRQLRYLPRMCGQEAAAADPALREQFGQAMERVCAECPLRHLHVLGHGVERGVRMLRRVCGSLVKLRCHLAYLPASLAVTWPKLRELVVEMDDTKELGGKADASAAALRCMVASTTSLTDLSILGHLGLSVRLETAAWSAPYLLQARMGDCVGRSIQLAAPRLQTLYLENTRVFDLAALLTNCPQVTWLKVSVDPNDARTGVFPPSTSCMETLTLTCDAGLVSYLVGQFVSLTSLTFDAVYDASTSRALRNPLALHQALRSLPRLTQLCWDEDQLDYAPVLVAEEPLTHTSLVTAFIRPACDAHLLLSGLTLPNITLLALECDKAPLAFLARCVALQTLELACSDYVVDDPAADHTVEKHPTLAHVTRLTIGCDLASRVAMMAILQMCPNVMHVTVSETCSPVDGGAAWVRSMLAILPSRLASLSAPFRWMRDENTTRDVMVFLARASQCMVVVGSRQAMCDWAKLMRQHGVVGPRIQLAYFLPL